MDELSSTTTGESTGASPADGASAESSAATGAPASNATGDTGTTDSGVQAQGAEASTATQEDKYAIPEDADIQMLRGKYRELNTDFKAVKQTAEQYTPWKDFTEKYQNPSHVAPLVEIASSLFTPVMENGNPVYRDGVPVTTTQPAIQMLFERDPQTFMTLTDEVAQFQVGGKSVIDWQLEAIGLNPANVEKYIEWEKNGGPNVATTGDAPTIDQLDQIPEAFRETFKTLPPGMRADILLMEDANQRFVLQSQQELLESKQFREAQTKQQEDRQREYIQQQQVKLQQEQTAAVDEVTDSMFGALLNEIVEGDWKPSADEATNSANYALLMGSICALADPDWSKRITPLLDKAGIQVDVPGFKSLMGQVSQAARDIKAHEHSGSTMQRNAAQANLDRSKFLLNAKVEGIKAELIGLLSGTRSEIRQAQESRISSAGARTVLNGSPANSGGGFSLPPGVKPFSREANQATENYLRDRAQRA